MIKKEMPTEKEKLEIEKLSIEIKELNRSWIQKPSYWSALLPFIIGIVAVWATCKSGILDAKRTLNEAKSAKLEMEIKEFQTTKQNIEKNIQLLVVKKDSLEKVIRETHQNTSGLVETRRDQQEIIEGFRIECEREKSWMKRTIDEQKKEIDKLKDKGMKKP